MTSILRIESSSNPNGLTRQLGNELTDSLLAKTPGAKLVTRDVVREPLPHISPEFFSVMYAGDNNAAPLALSEKLVAELLAADTLILEAPMYNFSIPSALKAWIDHVVRAGRTFSYGAEGPKGLTKIKKAYIVASSGGIYSDGAMKALEHTETYLRGVLGFIGITDVETIRTEGVAMGPEKAAAALANAKAQIAGLTAAA